MVELVVVIAVLAILAMIAIPVVSHTVNVATLNVALSNVQTLDSNLKLAIADVTTGNEETYGTSASDGSLRVGEVVKKQSIGDACEVHTYRGREIKPVWNQDTDRVELMYTDDNTNVETGTTITNFFSITETSSIQVINLA